MFKLQSALGALRFMVRRSGKPWGIFARSADYILSFLIYLGSVKKLKSAYQAYQTGASSPINVDHLIVGTNFMSKGKLRNKMVEDAHFQLNLSVFSQLPSILPEFDIDEQVNLLNLHGFTHLPVRLPINLVENLVDLAQNSHVVPTKYAKDRSSKPVPDPEIDHIWDVPFANSVESKIVQSVLQDKQLITLAAKYLNANPVVIGSRLYYSIAHKNREFLTPENWHVDAGDGLRFVKTFIALSNIESSNGPTGFIQGTHQSLSRKYYSGRRFFPEEIEQKFKGRFVEATGKVGTIYFVDTRGLHRGTPVREGSRLLFHYLYGTDFFGSARPTTFGLKRSACFGDGFQGHLARTFSAYRSNSPADTSKIMGP